MNYTRIMGVKVLGKPNTEEKLCAYQSIPKPEKMQFISDVIYVSFTPIVIQLTKVTQINNMTLNVRLIHQTHVKLWLS